MSETQHHGVKPSWGSRLAGLDGLRGVFVLAVILAHVIIILPSSDGTSPLLVRLTGLLVHGLTGFFVLSGFLLYRPYASAVVRGRAAPKVLSYFRNRVLRIWPVYLVILSIVGLVFGLAVVHNDGPRTAQRLGYLTDPLQLILNALLLQGWWPSTAFTGLGVSWSLVTEIGFYVLLPALGALAIRLGRQHHPVLSALIPALMLLVAGEAGRIITLLINGGADIPFGPTWLAVANRSIIGQGDLFAMGMLAAVTVVAADDASARVHRAALTVTWMLIAVAAIFVVAVGKGQFATPFMGLIFAGVITILRLPRPGAFARTAVRLMELAPIRALGEYSLSLYLWHYPVIWFLRIHVDASRYTSIAYVPVSLIIALVPTLLLGTITYRYVELPAMRRRGRTAPGQPSPRSAR